MGILGEKLGEGRGSERVGARGKGTEEENEEEEAKLRSCQAMANLGEAGED